METTRPAAWQKSDATANPLAIARSVRGDPVVAIPPSLPNGETGGPWLIWDGVAKLKRKYAEVLHSREFDGYCAVRAARDCGWPNRIEMADLLATWLMQSQIERRPGAIEAVIDRRAEIESRLADVPRDMALEEAIPEHTWEGLRSLFEAFRVKGVAVGTMTKVLCMKRPSLIPMMDTHVMGFLFQKERPYAAGRAIHKDADVAVAAMQQFRELILHVGNRETLTAIRHELTPWLNALEVSSGAAPALSLVRVLDCLLWYDWKGHMYFGVEEVDLTVPALVDRLGDSDHAIRWRAARALAAMGPQAREAVPALHEVLNEESESSLVGWWAEHALRAIS